MTAPLPRVALLALLLLVPIAVAGAQAPALMASPAASTAQLTAAPTAVRAGGTVRLTGTGFPHDVHVSLLAGPPGAQATRIGGATTGSRGRFVATIHTRAHSAAGTFVAQACVDGCRVKATARFRIAAR